MEQDAYPFRQDQLLQDQIKEDALEQNQLQQGKKQDHPHQGQLNQSQMDQGDLQQLICGLSQTDNKSAYQCLKRLLAESGESSKVYPYVKVFIQMMGEPNSYIRTRGLVLIAANARWDADHRIDEIIDEYLAHVVDEKPITARQCIQALPQIALHKPELSDDICAALVKANTQRYPGSMQPLVQKDIREALRKIRSLYE